MKDIEQIVRCLADGVVPKDKKMQRECRLIAIYAVALHLHSDETEPIAVHLVDRKTGFGIAIKDIDLYWTKTYLNDIIGNKKKIVANFEGTGTPYAVSTELAVYAAFQRLLSHPCPTCRQIFASEVNAARCEAAHSNAKKLTERSVRCASGLIDFWDGMDLDHRNQIAVHALPFVYGISGKFTATVLPLIEVARGDVDIPGHVLAAAMDEASEGTWLYRMSRKIGHSRLYTPNDYVAAMADVLVNLIAAEHTNAIAAELMSEPTTPKLTKAQRRMRALQERKAAPIVLTVKSPYIENVMWSAPAIPSWADAE